MRRIDELAIHAPGEGGFAQSRADVSCDLVDRYRLIEAALTAIRQSHDRHERYRPSRKKMVVASGIEPPTTSMSRRCSTTELRDCIASVKPRVANDTRGPFPKQANPKGSKYLR